MGLGQSHNYTLTPVEISELRAETGFTVSQINRIFRRFQTLDKEGKGYLTRNDLLELKEIVLNPVGDRVVDMFFPRGSDDRVYFHRFIQTFAVFRPPKKSTGDNAINSRQAKLRFLFTILDVNNEGYVSKDEFHDLLEMMMGATVSEEQIVLISERAIAEADTDRDGKLSFDEFVEANKSIEVENRLSFISFS